MNRKMMKPRRMEDVSNGKMLLNSMASYSPLQFGTPNIAYQEYSPAIPLLPYIHCYWMVTGDKLGENCCGTIKVLPDGCVDMIFEKCLSSGYVGTITGVTNEYLDIPVSKNMVFLGVRFRPGGMRALFRMNANWFSGQSVTVSDLHPRWAELQERLNANELQWREILNQYFLSLVRNHGNAQYSAQMANIFRQIYRHHGTITVQQLADHEGLSARQLQRLFYEWTGVSPKVFCRIVRFQYALKQLSSGRFHLDGYSDQAHFIREFRALSGVTPARFMSDFFNTNRKNGYKL